MHRAGPQEEQAGTLWQKLKLFIGGISSLGKP